MGESHNRVAIVDDDLSVRRGLKRLLEAHHWTVYAYDSAEEFLSDPGSFRVDIALVDLYLPGLGGIDLLKQIESAGGPPVILMTAHGEGETKDALLHAGRTSCLRKPFTFTQLLAAMMAA
jgi:DNA-binding response OmpR family regulator